MILELTLGIFILLKYQNNSTTLSIVFLAGLFLYWFKNKFDLISWLTLSTLIIFSIIGHKEIRYIFPIYIFAPFFVSYLLDHIKNAYILNFSKTIIIISNILFLILTLFIPPIQKLEV